MNKTCENCRHWRDKAWSGGTPNKGIGICDNPKVGVRPLCSGLLSSLRIEEWAVTEILQSVRFPNDFGCIFFEPINPTIWEKCKRLIIPSKYQANSVDDITEDQSIIT